ncbi:MAG TPA: DUF3800 domain-containing protein [Sphingobacteriaceae bacterium]|nr:DUF3800 domain-containing protein [Sphingobacteriaceae bacterium]
MEFEIFCDESSLEAIAKQDAHLYMGIGGIWLPAEHRESLKNGLAVIKNKYEIKGELKWKKVSPAYYNLYKEVIDYYFNSGYLRFRVILIEANKIDHIKFNNADPELGFYKFYYQLIKHWLFDFNSYSIFADLKENRNKGRLKELKEMLDLSNLTSEVKQVQGLPSEQSLGIQLADILTGLVVSKFNKEATSKAKLDLISYVESKYLSKEIAPTAKWEEKFNVFKINLGGGW